MTTRSTPITPVHRFQSGGLESVKTLVLDTIRDLDIKNSLGNLVDLRRIRTALPHMPRGTLDKALLALQADFVIDLNIANNPWGTSDHGESGILSERGVLYYATVRG